MLRMCRRAVKLFSRDPQARCVLAPSYSNFIMLESHPQLRWAALTLWGSARLRLFPLDADVLLCVFSRCFLTDDCCLPLLLAYC